MYKLQITQYVPLTEKELEERNKVNRNNYGGPFAEDETLNMKAIRVLDVLVSEEEFNSIKRATIAEM